jgi:hypothetical protein
MLTDAPAVLGCAEWCGIEAKRALGSPAQVLTVFRSSTLAPARVNLGWTSVLPFADRGRRPAALEGAACAKVQCRAALADSTNPVTG